MGNGQKAATRRDRAAANAPKEGKSQLKAVRLYTFPLATHYTLQRLCSRQEE